jgi:hypothetical protein
MMTGLRKLKTLNHKGSIKNPQSATQGRSLPPGSLSLRPLNNHHCIHISDLSRAPRMPGLLTGAQGARAAGHAKEPELHPSPSPSTAWSQLPFSVGLLL